MSSPTGRRLFLAAAASATAMFSARNAFAAAPLPRMGPIRQQRAGVLDVGVYEAGPADGPAVLLLHGFPYDIHSYVEVAPLLAAQGCRVIVPYLRGYGSTRFLDAATPRSGEQAAMGADALALMDALNIKRAVVAGYDWGGRGAAAAAILAPERVKGLVCVGGYPILNIERTLQPGSPKMEEAGWYQLYFQTERGVRGLTANRAAIARYLWTEWSPNWRFDDATFERTAASFDNPDFVAVVIHSYRHRFGAAPGDPRYAQMQARLDAQPPITVPAITLGSGGDGIAPATAAVPTPAKFTGPRQHRLVPGAGHNLPQEAPRPFADAVLELAKRPD